jgi:hypothetical protein
MRDAATAPRPVPRRSIAMIVITTLLGSMLAIAGSVFTASPANAQYAEGGSGLYQGSIDWFEWGNHGAPIPAGGMTRTNTRTVAGQTLATT